MKQLLVKEYKLTSCLLSFLFLGFSVMTLIPGYPILVSAFFMCLGIFYTFQFAREYNDIIYTALLPVAKADVVKARFSFVVTLQMAGFLLCLILTVVRMCFLSEAAPYVQNPLMNANFAYLGGILMIFAMFNLIFVRGFFQTAYAYGKPFIAFSVAAFLLVGLMETLHHIPGLQGLNSCGWEHMGLQLFFFLTGIILYSICTAVALGKSIQSFERIDLNF